MVLCIYHGSPEILLNANSVASQPHDAQLDGAANYEVLARAVRAAAKLQIPELDLTESAAELAEDSITEQSIMDISQVEAALYASRKQFVPDLSMNKEAYSKAERLTVLLAHKETKFIPAGTDELNSAFGLLHGLNRGGDAAKHLDDVAGRTYKDADPDISEQKKAEQKKKVVSRITQNWAAYARNASTTRKWLQMAANDIETRLNSGETYGSLAEYFTVNDTPVYAGPGQLARFIETSLATTDLSDLAKPETAFGARLGKDAQNKSIISDPFTAKQITPDIEQRQRELLGMVDMKSALLWLGLARQNHIAREHFWERRLSEARRDIVAGPVADAALRALTA